MSKKIRVSFEADVLDCPLEITKENVYQQMHDLLVPMLDKNSLIFNTLFEMTTDTEDSDMAEVNQLMEINDFLSIMKREMVVELIDN